ncbi:MAG: NAD(+)/NADH kinase [Treponema sp.]|nr:NAD(+)/NADH kinase [Treponema sp.]
MKKALIIINISKNESMDLSQEIKKYLETKSIEADFISFDGFCDNTSFEQYDFIVSLGGDGTVLYAARNAVSLDIPVFPVNLGQFGFIASIQPSEWKSILDNFLEGKEPFEERSMIKVEVKREGKLIYSSLGLNDAVISSSIGASTVSLKINYDNSLLCRLKADGIIISTSTGSTAYSVSAGGPIVDTHLDACVITPMNSFSLSSRPIVLSTEGIINVEIEPCRAKDLSISVDGQEHEKLLVGDSISICKYEKKIKLISCTREKFYNALRSKLNWSGGPHA